MGYSPWDCKVGHELSDYYIDSFSSFSGFKDILCQTRRYETNQDIYICVCEINVHICTHTYTYIKNVSNSVFLFQPITYKADSFAIFM